MKRRGFAYVDVKIESEKGISVLLGVVCFDGDCLIVEERSKMFDAAFLSLTHNSQVAPSLSSQ